jgi:hypothetical protein
VVVAITDFTMASHYLGNWLQFIVLPIPPHGLSCTHASDVGAPSAGNVDFIVIQTQLSFGF